ncbi:hypothetical protein [Lutispora sp.]|uniref:hypothetical protein n=1 Tax=Lutispora sp. TaxID=2828727 RepID=UPI00356B6114
MKQEWFEMQDIKRRTFERSVWIPLRAINQIGETGQFGFIGHKSEFFGASSLAIPLIYKSEAEKLSWNDIDISHDHCGYIQDEEYIPSNIFKDYSSQLVGEHLVLSQRGNRIEESEWHLNQDFVLTLGLKREGDIWVRPDEGYLEVAKLYRRSDKSPYLFEVRASHLKDYLCARKMALYINSYHQRVEVVESVDQIRWEKHFIEEHNDMDRWEGRISEIHEGGIPFGSTTAKFHVARTDVDIEEDVPNFGFPNDDAVKSDSWTKEHHGRKLYRIEGELWRNEWIDPAPNSPIVRGDKMPATVFFITDAEGTQENKSTLVKGSRWLWFRPEVVLELTHLRGGILGWYTRDTGGVGCSPGFSVHFGINKLGLLNVYAKDIGLLPDWQQKIWAGFNVSPDGKVSEELLEAQMKAKPANTQAPEDFLEKGLEALNSVAYNEIGIRILREHDLIQELIKKCHRFRSIDKAGLYALAKDVARLTADSVDATAIQTIIAPPKGTKWGSLKSLECLLAKKIDTDKAKLLLSSLVGVYELRHGDAHLPGSDVDEAFKLISINQDIPYVHQGYQLLHSCVSSIYGIVNVLKNWNNSREN